MPATERYRTVQMAAEPKFKVLLIGPSKVGKSCIANFLSEHTDTLRGTKTYQPTMALRCVGALCVPTAGAHRLDITVALTSSRVLECERDLSNDEYSGNHKVAVEIWDVAGDHKYEGGAGCIHRRRVPGFSLHRSPFVLLMCSFC